MGDGWFKLKLISILGAFVFVSAAGFGVYRYATTVSERVGRNVAARQRILEEQEPNVAPKEEYTNPLEEGSQYNNPFDEYQNPFDQ